MARAYQKSLGLDNPNNEPLEELKAKRRLQRRVEKGRQTYLKEQAKANAPKGLRGYQYQMWDKKGGVTPRADKFTRMESVEVNRTEGAPKALNRNAAKAGEGWTKTDGKWTKAGRSTTSPASTEATDWAKIKEEQKSAQKAAVDAKKAADAKKTADAKYAKSLRGRMGTVGKALKSAPGKVLSSRALGVAGAFTPAALEGIDDYQTSTANDAAGVRTADEEAGYLKGLRNDQRWFDIKRESDMMDKRRAYDIQGSPAGDEVRMGPKAMELIQRKGLQANTYAEQPGQTANREQLGDYYLRKQQAAQQIQQAQQEQQGDPAAPVAEGAPVNPPAATVPAQETSLPAGLTRGEDGRVRDETGAVYFGDNYLGNIQDKGLREGIAYDLAGRGQLSDEAEKARIAGMDQDEVARITAKRRLAEAYRSNGSPYGDRALSRIMQIPDPKQRKAALGEYRSLQAISQGRETAARARRTEARTLAEGRRKRGKEEIARGEEANAAFLSRFEEGLKAQAGGDLSKNDMLKASQRAAHYKNFLNKYPELGENAFQIELMTSAIGQGMGDAKTGAPDWIPKALGGKSAMNVKTPDKLLKVIDPVVKAIAAGTTEVTVGHMPLPMDRVLSDLADRGVTQDMLMPAAGYRRGVGGSWVLDPSLGDRNIIELIAGLYSGSKK